MDGGGISSLGLSNIFKSDIAIASLSPSLLKAKDATDES